MKKRIEIDIECKSCGATGLYVGMSEHDGAAIQCSQCKGTGRYKYVFEYTEFTERKPIAGVVRVFEFNPGWCIGTGKSGEYRLSDFGGIPYADWDEGKPFPQGSEMRRFVCPACWYQGVDYKKKPDWDECIGIGSFTSCTSFPTKEKCWERFDKEQIK